MSEVKPVRWIGSSRADLQAFPDEVRTNVGYALWIAQRGGHAPQAKPLRGIVSGAGVLELVERHDGDAYRVVYTVRFEEAVYVLHAFQKKSRKGIKTPPHEVDLIRRRLKRAASHHKELDQ